MIDLKKIKSISKLLSVVLLLGLVISGSNFSNSSSIDVHSVNAVLGDESYLETYGELPDEKVSENKRIVIHLRYVREKLLSSKIDHLTSEQVEKREQNLRILEEYIEREEFPTNEEYPNQRRPNFIDSEGNICAVGYLIEQTLGREVAESIKEKFQYEYVMNMDSQVLNSWAKTNGFSIKELAMIQPAYDGGGGCCMVGPGSGNNKKIDKSTEAFIIGSNVGLALFNGYSLSQNTAKLVPALTGVVLGSSTLTLGFTNQLNYSTTDYITGSISLAAGGWAIYSLFKKEDTKSNFTIAPIPSSEFEGSVGLSVNYSF